MLPQLLDPRPYFAHLPDPRRETRNKLHKPHDILMIVLCAVLSWVEDWVGMADFAEEKEVWLRHFLELPNGIPSHDTLSDVLGRIDPAAFRAAFTAWATAALPGLAGEPVCVDGKAVRGSRDGANPAVHLVSAFAGRARWVLAQQAVAEKANEITAIPDLLGLLDLRGAVVSLDAMGCQKAIAQTLVEAGADYVLALKDNHPTLCEEVQFWLDTEVARGRLPVLETVEKDHGRIEIRRYALSHQIDWLEAKPDWAGLQAVGRVESTKRLHILHLHKLAGLQAVGRVESTRILGENTSTECRYFLCSLVERDRFAATVRQHWGIENQQHWVLDVQFGEDACRTRKDHSAENLAVIRRMALNVLRHNGPVRDSLRRRKLRAALNDDYRLRLLFGQPSPVTTIARLPCFARQAARQFAEALQLPVLSEHNNRLWLDRLVFPLGVDDDGRFFEAWSYNAERGH
ncbi:MAG: ISAs1 family transposase [Candidatus Contendobacter sp.]|nr:ISAs1 family transposase [Candidatus Contendobacter sp.]MDG4557209.1 ISAs1 family transposase [Candidatus Contendobacter sp.]